MESMDVLPSVVEYYREFRTSIFLSSLTLGTFLFTMKTFIVQTLKKDVYDDLDHQEAIRYRRQEGHKDTYYGGLKRFSILIVWAIVLAFFSAFCQLTLGYLPYQFAAWLCLGISLASWMLVGVVLFLVSSNLSTWLEYSEKRAQARQPQGSSASSASSEKAP